MCLLPSRDPSPGLREASQHLELHGQECPTWQPLRTVFGSSAELNTRGICAVLGGETARRGNYCASLLSLCTLQTAQTCFMSQCKAVTTGHRNGTAPSCATLLAPPERLRGGTRRGKSGLRNCTLALCHWEATPGGLSAADIFGIIFMLLQSSPGLKSKI